VVDLFRFRHWDLVSKRGLYYVLSGAMLLAGIIAIFANASRYGAADFLNRGIDFKGGGLATYTVKGAFTDPAQIIQQVRDGLVQAGTKAQDEGLKNAEVQVASSGANDQILVHTLLATEKNVDQDAKFSDQIKTAITPVVNDVLTKAGKPAVTVPDSHEVVTGTISSELLQQGLWAIIIGSLLLMLWIYLRYNIGGMGFKYSAGGILALLHDLGTLIGMFAIFRAFLHVNSPFIAALLTVLGYSIHDTIVIYDRIRENMRLRKGRTFAETVNISLLETMARSVNTILTVLFTLLALFFFGGATLRDFVAAMLIGVVVGGYSSIFIASQLLVTWSKGKDRIVLPAGETLTPAMANAAPAAAVKQPVAVDTATSIGMMTPQQSQNVAASQEAIQRARQAGKTSKRKR